MSLNYEILSQALLELELELRDGQSWMMITEESGVSNVKSIAEGRIKPSIASWQQLHNAFPYKVPPPEMLDGEIVGYRSVHSSGKDQLIF